MDSGWGIRTLSALHPKYNPYSYQNGSVWPHDNAIIAIGFKRYGFHAEANRIARAICGSASYFLSNQLPELYAGIAHEPGSFPVQYIGANVPQAWAAGTPFALMQAILGIRPDAPNGKLYVDPTLPAWLPDLELRDLRMGAHLFSIRFWLDGEATRYEVIKGDKHAVVQRSFASANALYAD
jgi:glycogen debranching enzyme